MRPSGVTDVEMSTTSLVVSRSISLLARRLVPSTLSHTWAANDPNTSGADSKYLGHPREL